MLRDVVAVHIDIITVSVEVVVEDERRVHKRTGVNKTSPFLDFHLFNVEDKTSVEDLESDRALPAEQNDFVVCDLIGQTHIRWHPFRLIYLRILDFLPNISRNVIHFNCVDNSLLVDSASERKDVIVLEGTK